MSMHVSTAQATYHTSTNPLQLWHETQHIETLSLEKIRNINMNAYQGIIRLF